MIEPLKYYLNPNKQIVQRGDEWLEFNWTEEEYNTLKEVFWDWQQESWYCK